MTTTLDKRRDDVLWHPSVRILKYSGEQVEATRRALELPDDYEVRFAELIQHCGMKPEFGFAHDEGNLLTNIGLKRIWNVFLGTATWVTVDGTTRGRIGTGDSVTIAAVTDSNLGGAGAASNQYFQRFDSVPTVNNGVLTIIATFPTGQGNYAWNSWGIDGGTASSATVTSDAVGTPGLMNRRVPPSTLGTKTSAASWVFTVTVTLS